MHAMHYQNSPHPFFDLTLGMLGLAMLNLHTVADNATLDDAFTIIGWFVIAVGAVRSSIWIIRKIKGVKGDY